MSSETAAAPQASGKRLLVVTGEASGDLHGARLVAALQEIEPSIQVAAVGASELEATGAQMVGDSRTISVIGLSEALRILPQALRLQRAILEEVKRRPPDVALLIDSPDFNLRLAKKLHRRGVAVVYFISPQVWAWRQSRVELIRRVVERMLVLFPFEQSFYEEHDVPVECVGHPLVDEVPVLETAWERELGSAIAHADSSALAPESNTNDAPEKRPAERTVVLLPGSRRSEIRRLLPVMLQVAARLSAEGVRVRLIVAPSLAVDEVERLCAALDPAAARRLEYVTSDRFKAIAAAHAALCASGTATLEVGLIGTPMVVIYRVTPMTYWLGRRLIKVPHIALVNLVLEDRVVPELIQHEANPVKVENEVRTLLSGGHATQQMRRRLAPLRERLGSSGAARRAAEAVAQCLHSTARR